MDTTSLSDDTAIYRIDAFVDELKHMHIDDIYDPRGLARRCGAICAEASHLIANANSELQIKASQLIREMKSQGKISETKAKELWHQVQSLDLSDHDIEFVAKASIRPVVVSKAMQIARIVLLTCAFLTSYLLETYLRTEVFHEPEVHGVWEKFIGAAVIFVCQLLLFGRLGEHLETSIYWKLVNRTRDSALADLSALAGIYMERSSKVRMLLANAMMEK